MEQRQQGGGSGQQGGGGNATVDAQYGQPPARIFDHAQGRDVEDVLIVGKKADGTAFLWSTGTKQVAEELAKLAAPELVG